MELQAQMEANLTHPCFICKGACCETIVFDETKLSPNHHVWLSLHGEIKEGMIELECKCKRLLDDGTCGDYENRPEMCRIFTMGGSACLNTIKRRRSNYQQKKILAAIHNETK